MKRLKLTRTYAITSYLYFRMETKANMGTVGIKGREKTERPTRGDLYSTALRANDWHIKLKLERTIKRHGTNYLNYLILILDTGFFSM